MGKLTAILGIAALAGIGYYVGKKFLEKKNEEDEARDVFEDESEVFVEEKHSSPKEKLQKASLFAAGVIKTGTEKFKEGVDDILNQDMVAKGEKAFNETKDKAIDFAKGAKEKTVEFAKGAGESIKKQIDELKNSVESINKTPAESDDAENLANAIKKDVDDLTASEIDMASELNNGPEPVVSSLDDDAEEDFEDLSGEPSKIITEAADEDRESYDVYRKNDESRRTSDELDSMNIENIADSVETFDFSSSEDEEL